VTSAYDRILIGPTQVPRPHWRRGHFRRIRFGEQLSESRLGWIRPVLDKASDRPSGRQIRQSGGGQRSDGAAATPSGLDADLSRWNAETPTATQTATVRIDKSYTPHEDACILCVCSQWSDSCVMPPSISGRCLSSVI
jgi:hypothetical protein